MISAYSNVLVKVARLGPRRAAVSLSLTPSSLKSTLAQTIEEQQQALAPDGDVVSPRQEVIRFPSSATSTNAAAVKEETTPVLLNSKEHAVGYLSKILNARVYDAAIETELQDAKNLSTVRLW